MNKFSFFLCLWLRLCYACENGGKAICFSWPVILVPGSGSLWQKTFDGRGIKLRWKVRRASTKCCTTNIVAISRTETKMPTRVMSWPQKGFVFISFAIASLALPTPSNNSAWGLFLEKMKILKRTWSDNLLIVKLNKIWLNQFSKNAALPIFHPFHHNPHFWHTSFSVLRTSKTLFFLLHTHVFHLTQRDTRAV